jgi:hypothetical protein
VQVQQHERFLWCLLFTTNSDVDSVYCVCDRGLKCSLQGGSEVTQAEAASGSGKA